MSNTNFLQGVSIPKSLRKRRVFSSEFESKSHAHKPHLRTGKPLSHDTKSFFSVHVVLLQIHIEKDDFASSNSIKIWCTSLCEPVNSIRKQLKLSLTMLKTRSFSENDVFPWIRVRKDGSHLRPQLNIWYKCFDCLWNPVWEFQSEFAFVA